jgi:hypothetical protein
MCIPDNEHEQLLKINEDLSGTLLTSLLDVKTQIKMLDARQRFLQRDKPKGLIFWKRQEEWKQIRKELIELQVSLEQWLLRLHYQHCRLPHQVLQFIKDNSFPNTL